jgi:hypothetical protein
VTAGLQLQAILTGVDSCCKVAIASNLTGMILEVGSVQVVTSGTNFNNPLTHQPCATTHSPNTLESCLCGRGNLDFTLPPLGRQIGGLHRTASRSTHTCTVEKYRTAISATCQYMHRQLAAQTLCTCMWQLCRNRHAVAMLQPQAYWTMTLTKTTHYWHAMALRRAWRHCHATGAGLYIIHIRYLTYMPDNLHYDQLERHLPTLQLNNQH